MFTLKFLISSRQTLATPKKPSQMYGSLLGEDLHGSPVQRLELRRVDISEHILDRLVDLRMVQSEDFDIELPGREVQI